MARVSHVLVGLGVAAAFAAGCKKKDAGAASSEGSGGSGTGGDQVGGMKPDPVTAGTRSDAPPPVFAKLDLPGRAKALEGVWVMNVNGKKTTAEIKGDDVTTWDGKVEVKAKLKVDAPCAVGFAVAKNGGEETTTYTLVIKDGKPHLGLGGGGEKVGKGAVVCAGMGVLVVDDAGTCTEWDHFFKWEAKPAKCGFRQDAGKEVFFFPAIGGEERTIPVDGTTIMDEQLTTESAAAAADVATGRKIVDDEALAHDPGHIAELAGGKVGDTATVAGLAATFAAGKDKVIGQKVKVTGRYLSSSWSTSGDVTTYTTTLAVDKDHDKPTLDCLTAGKVEGLTQWDEVLAEGTVKELFPGEPTLDGCTVAKKK